jgi:hypothetical protein
MSKKKKALSNDDIVYFGLYKGRTISYIKKKDPKYIEFLRKTKGILIN